MNELVKVLVLIHTMTGGTHRLAQSVASGIEDVSGVRAVIKQVPLISPAKRNPELEKIPEVTLEELGTYDGIALGSPIHFGNMSADMRAFLDRTVPLWKSRRLEGMPATVFMSAGSGAGREVGILSFWSTLASHGMILIPSGMAGVDEIDASIPQGHTIFGTTSLRGLGPEGRPSSGELHLARLQGVRLGRTAKALRKTDRESGFRQPSGSAVSDFDERLKKLGIELPSVPDPVGNYLPFQTTGNLVYINQIALQDGKVLYPGMVGREVSEEQAKKSTRQAMLNVLAVLKKAVNGDFGRVRKVVQLTGIFYTDTEYKSHASLMNEASNLTVDVFGDKGLHTRATLGASSLPLHSPVEIQAVFELE